MKKLTLFALLSLSSPALLPLFSMALSQEINIKYVHKVLSVYDGDSFRADITGLPDIVGKNMPIRISGVDTPEIRGKCSSEKELAVKAKNFTASALKNGHVIALKNIRRGKYFRLIADVYIDGKKLSDLLLSEGLAYEYHGKTKKSWC